MKHEIIYTEDYALIVSDEQIKDVRLYKGKFHLEKGYIINQFPTYLTDLSECKLVIAHRPLTDVPILEGVPLLPKFSKKDDVKKIAEKQFYLEMESPLFEELGVTKKVQKAILIGMLQGTFTRGYNKAKETYIEILKSIESLCDNQNPTHEAIWRLCYSVQQTKRPKYFECKMETSIIRQTQCVNKCASYPSECLCEMTKETKMKTITNSQGNLELVGEYIYE